MQVNKQYKVPKKEAEYEAKYDLESALFADKYYAVYEGDDFICEGTLKECGAYCGVKPNTLLCYYYRWLYEDDTVKYPPKYYVMLVDDIMGEDDDEW